MILPRQSKKELVFLAGGVGIAPFYSMFKQVFHTKENFKIRFFYSNRSIEESAFLEELFFWEKSINQFYFFPTMTSLKESSTWLGLKSLIDKEMLVEKLGNLQDKYFFVAGPPNFSGAMKDLLIKSKIKEENLFIESFVGY